MIKVCHLSSVHQPYDVRIFHKECKSLAANGYEVHYVVSDIGEKPLVEMKEGVIIHRIKKSSTRITRVVKVVNEIYKEAKKIDAEIYHLHDSELLRIGNKLLKRNKKVVYDIHEDLPRQILSKPYIPKIFRSAISSMVEFFENHYARKMSALVAATAFIHNRFLKINPLTIDINNFPKLSELNFEIDWKQKENEICYIGSITKIRGISELIIALEKTTATLNLAGEFESGKLKKEIENLPGWQKTKYGGFANRTEVKNILIRSKIGVVTLYPVLNYLDALPVKLFEYMAAGIPSIASDFPLLKNIIEKIHCGICVNPLDSDEIAKAINKILSNEAEAQEMGLNGRKAVLENFNWELEEIKLLNLYKNLLARQA